MFLMLSVIWKTKPAGIKMRTGEKKVFEKDNFPGAETLFWGFWWWWVFLKSKFKI